jgi:hypothetical protein
VVQGFNLIFVTTVWSQKVVRNRASKSSAVPFSDFVVSTLDCGLLTHGSPASGALRSVLDGELVFAYAAFRTAPIFGHVFERRSRRDAVRRVACFRVIDITAYIANVFFHNEWSFLLKSMIAERVKQIGMVFASRS